MEGEQIIEMVEEYGEEELGDIEWWDAAWSRVEPYAEQMDREDKTVFGWAIATAMAREIDKFGDFDEDRVRFMAAVFSMRHGYTPDSSQVTGVDLVRGMHEYVMTYGRDEFVEELERGGRFSSLWQRAYRESDYMLSLTPSSIARLMEEVREEGRISEETLREISIEEDKSLRSIAFNLRYLHKVTGEETYLEAARLAERLHRGRR